MLAGLVLAGAIGLAGTPGCKRPASPSPAPPSTQPATVASLVPAATDLLIGMGARDRLVAVSTYDAQRPDVRNLPRVGDYQTTDWETLSSLDPTWMVIQIDPAHLPAGLVQRAAAQHTQLLNVAINRLDDIPRTLRQLGDALQVPAQGNQAADDLQHRLAAVHASVAGQPAVPALLVVGEGAHSVAGPETFLNDLLSVARGTNVAAPLHKSWPQIDQEMLLSLQPRVVIVLLPDPSLPVRQQVIRDWRQLRAARPGERVYLIDAWYALLPGWHVPELAAQFASCLHGTPLPAGTAAPSPIE